MGKDAAATADPDHVAKLAYKKAQILAKRQKKKLFHSTNPLLVSKKERQVQKVIAKKNQPPTLPTPGGDVDLLMRETSSRLAKIKKQTLFLVKLDKFAVRDAVEALRAYFQDLVEQRERSGRRDDVVELVITISKVLAKVTLKPIRLPVMHPVHSPQQKGLCCLLHKDGDKRVDAMKDFCATNRVQVSIDLTQIISVKKFGELVKDEKKAKHLLRSWDTIFCDEAVYDAVRKRGYKLFMKKKK